MKLSILDKFAQDAINAPSLVTGGGKGCGTKKTKKSKKSKKTKKSKKSKKSGSGGGGCYVPSPCASY